jgi:nitrite reductase (NO-forming)
MKNIFIAVIVIIGITGVWYFLTQSEAEAPTTVEQDATAQEQEPEETQTTESDVEVDVEADGVDASFSVADSGEKTFTVSGSNFAFDVSEIRVQEGDTVTINFESADGFHDWVVDEFSAATQKVQTGNAASVTFVADKAGSYEYYCSVGQHRANGMVGTLIVE